MHSTPANSTSLPAVVALLLLTCLARPAAATDTIGNTTIRVVFEGNFSAIYTAAMPLRSMMLADIANQTSTPTTPTILRETATASTLTVDFWVGYQINETFSPTLADLQAEAATWATSANASFPTTRTAFEALGGSGFGVQTAFIPQPAVAAEEDDEFPVWAIVVIVLVVVLLIGAVVVKFVVLKKKPAADDTKNPKRGSSEWDDLDIPLVKKPTAEEEAAKSEAAARGDPSIARPAPPVLEVPSTLGAPMSNDEAALVALTMGVDRAALEPLSPGVTSEPGSPRTATVPINPVPGAVAIAIGDESGPASSPLIGSPASPTNEFGAPDDEVRHAFRGALLPQL